MDIPISKRPWYPHLVAVAVIWLALSLYKGISYAKLKIDQDGTVYCVHYGWWGLQQRTEPIWFVPSGRKYVPGSWVEEHDGKLRKFKRFDDFDINYKSVDYDQE